MKRTIMGSVAVTVVVGGFLAASAATSAQAVPPPCGFYEVGSGLVHDDMYNHCGDHPVLVTMVGFGIYNQYTACLSPGVHNLYDYFNASVVNAYSEGEPCSNPEG
ncbi:DUF6355 family natural product biosynthesis protein [Jiangella endophytica]|uniref:DUF6355 family natural product biosynthesis protein n=1 Tax=Jiangella endophytica TaxID=1623398 RepID=UPI001300835A|nr:DUF6355 family natural product biosynthesis protein [Jiangella endophytica]